MITYTLERDNFNPNMFFLYKEVDGESIKDPPGKSILAIIYRDWDWAIKITAELNGENTSCPVG